MLGEGSDYLREAWWIWTFAGLGIMLTVLAITSWETGCATSSIRGSRCRLYFFRAMKRKQRVRGA